MYQGSEDERLSEPVVLPKSEVPENPMSGKSSSHDRFELLRSAKATNQS